MKTIQCYFHFLLRVLFYCFLSEKSNGPSPGAIVGIVFAIAILIIIIIVAFVRLNVYRKYLCPLVPRASDQQHFARAGSINIGLENPMYTDIILLDSKKGAASTA